MIRISFTILILFLLGSCARQGSPTGGPKDSTPPKFLKANPDTLSKNVSTLIKEIRLDFDEYIVLKEAQKQIIVSPPLKYTIVPTQNSPRKYVLITLKDTLQPNTTYNINFAESIRDNNEGNTLSNFQYTFSTGKTIDSLQLNGKVTNALTDEINEKTLVALYKKTSDEIDFKTKPYYVTKIDTLGNYKLNYLSAGNYYVIAFNDENFNGKFDEDKEQLAFDKQAFALQKNATKNLILSQSKPKYKALEAKQKAQGQIVVRFKGKPKSVDFEIINDNFPKDFTTEFISETDSAMIWFNTQKANFQDKNERLKIVVKNQEQKDTLQLLYDTKLKTTFEIKSVEKELVPNEIFELQTNFPIETINLERITIIQNTKNIPFESEINNTNLKLKFPIEFASSYQIKMLPKAIITKNETQNDSLLFTFKTKAKNEYGNLRLILKNTPQKPFFVQLMQGETKVREVYGTNSVIDFNYLKPAEYYFKILVDENENKSWDFGSYYENQQPEKTYIYPFNVTVRAFWDINETWNLSP